MIVFHQGQSNEMIIIIMDKSYYISNEELWLIFSVFKSDFLLLLFFNVNGNKMKTNVQTSYNMKFNTDTQ